jgi:hypothetical protein
MWNGNEGGKIGGNENLKTVVRSTDHDWSKTPVECAIFQIFP